MSLSTNKSSVTQPPHYCVQLNEAIEEATQLLREGGHHVEDGDHRGIELIQPGPNPRRKLESLKEAEIIFSAKVSYLP